MKRVLVIDDTKNIRNLLSTCLEIRGYNVITADNGVEALRIIKNKDININLIFLDIRMPGISGTELLKTIKEERESCPVIIMTAFATVKNAIECTKLGALVYLQKPFSTDRINSVLAEIEEKMEGNIENNEEDNLLNEVKLLLNNKEDVMKAHKLLKKAIGFDPYNKEVYLLISKVNEILGKTEEAERFEKIYKLF